ncbi:MAG TPA: D-glycerate dehydrogenase, partial [Thermoleophilia bacterium]|nr:D-glycerate dehydrogenase [Thermoleophilia bacterium]
MIEEKVCFLTRLVAEPGPRLLKEAFAEVRGNFEERNLDRAELLAGVREADALYCMLTDTIDAEVLDAAGPRLRVVSNMAVGYDNVDVPAATARGVLVTNTPGVLTETTADLAWALLLAAARRVVEGDRLVRGGGFHMWSPTMLLGGDVNGKTLGIVGMGRIGQAVARRSTGFGMKVLYTRPSGPLDTGSVPTGADWLHVDSLEELLRNSDFVSLHVPLSEETRHLLGRREFELMGPQGVLVNTSRGPVVDEAALVEALATGTLGAAALDVYEREPELAPGLSALTNVVLLPHLGSATRQTRAR